MGTRKSEIVGVHWLPLLVQSPVAVPRQPCPTRSSLSTLHLGANASKSSSLRTRASPQKQSPLRFSCSRPFVPSTTPHAAGFPRRYAATRPCKINHGCSETWPGTPKQFGFRDAPAPQFHRCSQRKFQTQIPAGASSPRGSQRMHPERYGSRCERRAFTRGRNRTRTGGQVRQVCVGVIDRRHNRR